MGHDEAVGTLLVKAPSLNVNARDGNGATPVRRSDLWNAMHAFDMVCFYVRGKSQPCGMIGQRGVRLGGNPACNCWTNFHARVLIEQPSGYNRTNEFTLPQRLTGTSTTTPQTAKLLMAARTGHDKVVATLLLAPDIDLSLARNDGTTAVAIAKRNGHDAIAQALEEAAAS